MLIKTIDDYIGQFPPEVALKLTQLRQVVKDLAPEAEEKIGYGIPTFKLQGKNLVHFAAFKNHIGFYPSPTPIATFAIELAPYKKAKGSVQFPLDQPLPMSLIEKMVKFMIKQITA